MSDVSKAVLRLCPKAEFSVLDNDPEQIEWFKPAKTARPTVADISAEMTILTDEEAATEYQELRKVEYPSMEDLADAIYWQDKGEDGPMADYLSKCSAVKQQFPKP